MSSHATGDGGIPPRDVEQLGLKRVMTLGGAYGLRNYTVRDLRDQKGRRVLTETLPFSPEEAMRLGYAAMKAGFDAIMCQWAPRFIEAAAEAGIPVQGHAGLVPRRSTWTGGLRAVGKTLDEALWVYRQIKTLESAGAYAVEVEVIPEALLAEISTRTSLLTSSIGAGSGGDIQFLFAEDILGNNPPPYPRHSNQYRELYKLRQAMQAERVAAFGEFIADVRGGAFPAPQHVVKAPDGLIEQFVKSADAG